MTRSTLSFLAAASAMVPAATAAGEVQIPVNGPLIELTVSESVGSVPDVVNLSAGVNATSMVASEALDQNARRMAQVIAAIEAQGVAERDIRTSRISLNPQYEWNEIERRQVFRGYQVSSTVEIRLREVPRTGPAQDQAREAAFATARERALLLARQAGYADVRLLEVSEGAPGWSGPQPLAMDAAVEARNMTMPIRPGEVASSVTISVKYEMAR